MLGADISQVEISGVTKHGFWLLLDDQEELFISFAEFPWFRLASIKQIFCVERPQPYHLYWPELDIDLHVDSIRYPDRFPLVARP